MTDPNPMIGPYPADGPYPPHHRLFWDHVFQVALLYHFARAYPGHYATPKLASKAAHGLRQRLVSLKAEYGHDYDMTRVYRSARSAARFGLRAAAREMRLVQGPPHHTPLSPTP